MNTSCCRQQIQLPAPQDKLQTEPYTIPTCLVRHALARFFSYPRGGKASKVGRVFVVRLSQTNYKYPRPLFHENIDRTKIVDDSF